MGEIILDFAFPVSMQFRLGDVKGTFVWVNEHQLADFGFLHSPIPPISQKIFQLEKPGGEEGVS